MVHNSSHILWYGQKTSGVYHTPLAEDALWLVTSADQACSDTCSDTFIGQSLSCELFLSTFLELWERLMRSGCALGINNV